MLDQFDVEEVSLGDFVLTGGEIAAQAMLDATVRMLGTCGHEERCTREVVGEGTGRT